jgi:hypothetical protein
VIRGGIRLPTVVCAWLSKSMNDSHSLFSRQAVPQGGSVRGATHIADAVDPATLRGRRRRSTACNSSCRSKQPRCRTKNSEHGGNSVSQSVIIYRKVPEKNIFQNWSHTVHLTSWVRRSCQIWKANPSNLTLATSMGHLCCV